MSTRDKCVNPVVRAIQGARDWVARMVGELAFDHASLGERVRREIEELKRHVVPSSTNGQRKLVDFAEVLLAEEEAGESPFPDPDIPPVKMSEEKFHRMLDNLRQQISTKKDGE